MKLAVMEGVKFKSALFKLFAGLFLVCFLAMGKGAFATQTGRGFLPNESHPNSIPVAAMTAIGIGVAGFGRRKS
jgi:hypothetical protein